MHRQIRGLHMLPVSRRDGFSLLGVLLLVGAVGMAVLVAQRRLAFSAQQSRHEQLASERAAVRNYVANYIDCDRTLAGYNASFNQCPAGKKVMLSLLDQATSVTPPGMPASSWALFPDWPAPGLQWLGELQCGKSSLELRVGLWDPAANAYVHDPMTGAALDFTEAADQLTGAPPLPTLCPKYFGGRPDLRLYSLDASVLTQYDALYDQDGQLVNTATDCDGTLGPVIAGWLKDPKVCAPSNPFCGKKGILKAAVTCPKKVMGADCVLFDQVTAQHYLTTYCTVLCTGVPGASAPTWTKYQAGRGIACNPGAPSLGPAPVPDIVTGQVVCLCMN